MEIFRKFGEKIVSFTRPQHVLFSLGKASECSNHINWILYGQPRVAQLLCSFYCSLSCCFKTHFVF